MTVKPTTQHRVTHDGHEVLFCSAGCKAKLVADPVKYLRPAPAPAAAPTPRPPAGARVEYTCPMHPEIVRDAPGSCPLCGMAPAPILPSTPPASSSSLPSRASRSGRPDIRCRPEATA